MHAPEIFPNLNDDASLQINADGSLRHLLTLRGLNRSLLIRLLVDDERFFSVLCFSGVLL